MLVNIALTDERAVAPLDLGTGVVVLWVTMRLDRKDAGLGVLLVTSEFECRLCETLVQVLADVVAVCDHVEELLGERRRTDFGEVELGVDLESRADDAFLVQVSEPDERGLGLIGVDAVALEQLNGIQDVLGVLAMNRLIVHVIEEVIDARRTVRGTGLPPGTAVLVAAEAAHR